MQHHQFLVSEANALRVRLGMVKPFEQTMPTVPAANISKEALNAIHHLLKGGVGDMNQKIQLFLRWMRRPRRADKAQRQFALLKLKFNALLDQLDIFADVLTQRGEHETGVWIGGLDVVAENALKIRGGSFDPPPLISYLDRGHGAAIRRARTRLPGGKQNPVAVIRVPRERMVSSGIASSLIHEVGHQGSALLGLIPSIRPILLQKEQRAEAQNKIVWQLFHRWISEILSDFWAVAHLGVSATTGLIGVVTLPRYFVFRMNLDDPHPFPWIRVKISCGFGRVLYPDPQWDRIEHLWDSLYPVSQTKVRDQHLIKRIEALIPAFVQLVLKHRPQKLNGRALYQAFPVEQRQPGKLRRQFQIWDQQPGLMRKAGPTLVFATIGQARADEKISPAWENQLLTDMLTYWATRKSISNHKK